MCHEFRIGIVVAVLALVVSEGTTDTITVCWDGSGDYLTIQEGIDAAADGDEVVVCDGTYTGAGNKNMNFGGKAITVRSANGPDNCIIDCENNGRAFDFFSGEDDTSVIEGLTIRNGSASDGGAVRCYNASGPTITNCVFNGNSAINQGGAIYCYNYSRPTISASTFVGNTANGDGGGAYFRDQNFGGPTITDCTFTGNHAGFHGGGVCFYHDTEGSISDCTISNNSANIGGGIECYNSSPRIIRCAINNNQATGSLGNGGGIGCDASGCSPQIISCTIVGNTATNEGGGIQCDFRPSPTITNCTISDNSAERGGGLMCRNTYEVTVANCILWGDTANSLGPEIGLVSSTLTIAYSDVEGGQAAVWNYSSTLNWGAGMLETDPLCVDPDAEDYHLSAGSPCIDAADNDALPQESTGTDLDGNPRFVDDPCTPDSGNGDPPIVDMGAYEYQPCAGDLDCDGETGQPDLGILLASWGIDGGGDLDGDDDTDQGDLGILLADWGCGT